MYLRSVARERLGERLGALQFYLFGSALSEPDPADMDVLVVYEKSRVSVPEILALRREISAAHGSRIDVTLMSDEEARTNSFISDERCVPL
jgi:predicted nucleotidyltransferase